MGRGARRRAAVPAGPRPTGGGGGRHRGQGVPAALGRTAAARELAQGGQAACARGGRRVPRRRRPRIWVGNRSGSRRRPQLSSPWVDLGRRRSGRGSSAERAEFVVDGDGERRSERLISAGEGLGPARGWSEWVDGESARLRARRIEAGWRAVAGAVDGGDSARPSSARARGWGWKGRT